MKPVYLVLSDEDGKKIREVATTSLKAGKFDDLLALTERAAEMKETKSVKTITAFYNDLKVFMCDVFKNKISIDEINEYVEQDDLMNTFTALNNAIGGKVKN